MHIREEIQMIGLGTLINVSGILLGGLLGALFGKAINVRIQETLMKATGLCVIFLGIGGAIEKMMTVTETGLTSGGTMMIIGSFAIGSLIGEIWNIEKHLEHFGEWLKEKTKNDRDTKFEDGFVNTSLTVCIGAMAVVGAIQDGIAGDYSILAAKAVLDMIIVIIMTTSMGKGCIFSVIPVALFQGCITILSRFIEPWMTEQALANLSLTGSMLIFCVGVNLIWEKKFKVANMLPTIVIAVIWALLPFGA